MQEQQQEQQPRRTLTPEQKERRRAAQRAYRQAHPETQQNWRNRNREHVRQLTKEASDRHHARQRAAEVHPCPRCGNTAYLGGKGAFRGLCQPCATGLSAIQRGIGLWGIQTDPNDTPITGDEWQWETNALCDAYLPSLEDRLHRNHGFDAAPFDSYSREPYRGPTP